MNSIYSAIANTPWWVFALFVYLVLIGYRARMANTLSLGRLAIVPAVFTVWSLYSLLEMYGVDFAKLTLWLISFVLGGILGWLLTLRFKIHADKQKKLIRLPGSWLLLSLILIIFAVKYFFGYTFAVHPESKDVPVFYVLNIFCSGFISGMFVGRFVSLFRKYCVASHTTLKKSS